MRLRSKEETKETNHQSQQDLKVLDLPNLQMDQKMEAKGVREDTGDKLFLMLSRKWIYHTQAISLSWSLEFYSNNLNVMFFLQEIKISSHILFRYFGIFNVKTLTFEIGITKTLFLGEALVDGDRF